MTAKNVQRGLAQKVQDMSAMFRKKQRVYMQSELPKPTNGVKLTTEELQGHAIKNKDLLAASGAITLKGSDVLDELAEDEQAVRPYRPSSLLVWRV
jgi:syntaxin 16